MSSDLKTFQVLQASSMVQIPDELVSMSDEAIAARMEAQQNTGFVLTDEDIKSYNMDGFGINFEEVDRR